MLILRTPESERAEKEALIAKHAKQRKKSRLSKGILMIPETPMFPARTNDDEFIKELEEIMTRPL